MPRFSARFALGLPVNQTAFVVMPDLEAGWASLMPWDYAAMREGEPSLYLVTQPLTIDGVETPDFGVSFHIPDFAKAQALSTREILQLRRYKGTARGWSVDSAHFAEMPLRLLSSKAQMASGLRWTEKDLERHLKRTGSKATTPGTSRSANATAAAPESVKKTGRKPRAAAAVDSLKTATITGHHRSGEYIEFLIEGATLLSVNDLYALHYYQRIPYRKAWHELINNALLLITRGPRNWTKFTTFRLTIHMRTPGGCDNDALNSYFKYAIDGLRYAGLIEDDSPRHMLSIDSSQEMGKKLLRIRVDAISVEEVQRIRAANLVGAGASSKAMLGDVADGDPALTVPSGSTRAELEGVAGDS
ncbi:hypothetical protein DAPPUDRAFT_124625 [Daphnia pulex]|uniref:Uncharacterized protein n=1 Tax=Daphnia pulex TaxID=6669 RepID=E9I6S6_DAPPU|nr:hypothetical protein DAPPUDRAFT_124625 [Daphnia pulex]|eukprot:EFX60304.1 hypothetical protein DAPPUDRAFT_124625 [Daphnia pulex]